jgi:hypothetical protein
MEYLGDPAILPSREYSLGRPGLPLQHEHFPGRIRQRHAGRQGLLQPDKAGSFGAGLVGLYKATGNQRYLDAALKIATPQLPRGPFV